MGSLTGPGLGKFECLDLATCSISDLGTADAGDITSGTFGLARIPSIDNAHLAGGITSDKIPALSGTVLAYPINADTVGTTQIIAGGVANSELAASGLDISKFTIGTAGVDRIPVLPTSRYGSAVLVDGSRAMAGTLNIGNHLVDDVKKIGFRDIHDVALITEGTYTMSLVSKDALTGGTLKLNYIFPYAGIHWTISDKQAGADLSAGDLVYLKSDGKWWKTDADAEATTKGMLGLAIQTKTAGQTVRVLVFGRVTATGWSWTVGAPIFVSCTTGGLTHTAPSGSGDQVRKIGHALSSDTIIFNPDATIIELS